MGVRSYRIHNLFGDLLAEGTVPKCAAQLGVSEGTLRWYINEGCGKFVIEETTADAEKAFRQDLLDACAAWDAFCEPIRQRYGIAVRKQQGDEHNE